ISQHINWISVGEPAQSDQQTNACAPRRLQRRRAPGEEDPKQLAIPEQVVEFSCRDPDEEQDKYPHLRREEARPTPDSENVLNELAAAQHAAINQVVNERFEKACNADEGGVD